MIVQDRSLSETEMTALVERIQGGDATAESEFAGLYSGRILVMTLARTHNREVSRDLTQDVLIAVLQAIRNKQIRDPGRLAAFVCGTTRNLVNDYFRSFTLQPAIEPLPDELPMAGTDDPELAVQFNRVQDFLARLEATDRKILLMTLVEGYKAEEAAFLLNLSCEAVRKRKSRAIKKISERIKNMSRR